MVLVLDELTDGFNELSGSRAKKFFKRYKIVLLTCAFAEFFLAEKVYDRRSPEVKPSKGERCGLGLFGVGGAMETEKGIVDGETGTSTEGDLLFVEGVEALLSRKINRARK